VPSIYQFMAQHPAFAPSDFSRLVIGGVGGAPMPVPLLEGVGSARRRAAAGVMA
jgi:fatty-acyl-CoA synthase